MLSSIRPYGLPADPGRNAPVGRPKPGPAEVPADSGRTAPGANPAPTPTPLPTEPARTAAAAHLSPLPTPLPTDEGRTAPADDTLRLTYRADGRTSDGPPPPTGLLFDRRG